MTGNRSGHLLQPDISFFRTIRLGKYPGKYLCLSVWTNNTGQQQICCLGFLSWSVTILMCWIQKSHWFCSIKSTFVYSATWTFYMFRFSINIKCRSLVYNKFGVKVFWADLGQFWSAESKNHIGFVESGQLFYIAPYEVSTCLGFPSI